MFVLEFEERKKKGGGGGGGRVRCECFFLGRSLLCSTGVNEAAAYSAVAC